MKNHKNIRGRIREALIASGMYKMGELMHSEGYSSELLPFFISALIVGFMCYAVDTIYSAVSGINNDDHHKKESNEKRL